MRKPVVDYRQFRFKKLNQPEFSHLWFLLGWVGYFTLYTLTEIFIPHDKCYPVHCFLDDLIPFCEFFIVPYVLWYALVAGTLLYFALYNPDNFKRLMKFIIVTQIVAMAVYIIFPNRQDLRPTEFTRENFFTDVVKLLYTIDTNTNVCPSLHVGYSIGIASAWLKEKSASPLCKVLLTLFCVTVCISVAFVKQHSVVDIFAALPMCLLAEIVGFGDVWLARFKKIKKKEQNGL